MFPFPFGFIGSGEVIPDLELISNDYAMEFDAASSQYVSAGNPIELQITGALTVSSWFKILNNSGDSVIVCRDNGNTARNWFIYMTSAGKVAGYVRKSDDTTWGGSTLSPSVYDDGNWHHVAMVYTPSTSLVLYIDGAAVDTNTTSITSSINNEVADLTIGMWSRNPTAYSSNYWNGDIDEVAVWNKALEAADVQTIYNSTNNNPGKCANLFTGGLGSGLVYWNRMGD